MKLNYHIKYKDKFDKVKSADQSYTLKKQL